MMKSYVVVLSTAALSLVGCISAERKAEYQAWRASDDGISTASIETFEAQYKSGWQERAAEKKKARLAKEAKVAAERKRLAKERAEAERVRLAKEAAERAEKMRLAMRTELYEKTVEHDLASIRKKYNDGRQFENPFPQQCGGDWLAKWASPRLRITESDALAGEALLSEFGTKYLPNAYANYEKKREALAELQQVFNEEFPQPWTIKTTSPKWNSFNKVLEKFVKVRTESFICHDELCHYWLLSRLGVLTGKDFAEIDAKRLAVHLLPENVEQAEFTISAVNAMEGKIADFANKYAPESSAIYQRMSRELKELDALLVEVFKQRNQMDDVRYSRALGAAVFKRNDLARELNTLSLMLQTWYTDHRTTEKSSEDVAKCDAEMGKQLKPFMDSLPMYIKEHALGPIIANSEMIAIPGQRYRMQRTEVTQLQWMAVMGNNPSYYRGPDFPVAKVSWNDCLEFIERASQLDGRAYRLPTKEEWEFACRAGSTTDWGKRKNGECGPLEVMGWCFGDRPGKNSTHAVAQKESNAWGLFDMHGNVNEWCQGRASYSDSHRVICGGSWCSSDYDCKASHYESRVGYDQSNDCGFRLAASLDWKSAKVGGASAVSRIPQGVRENVSTRVESRAAARVKRKFEGKSSRENSQR